MLLVAGLCSLVIGVALGMLGGGGAILTLPMLVYLLALEPKTAIATSLFVVGATSLVAATAHARAGLVRWGIGSLFAAAAMAGAFAGGRIAAWVPAPVLLLLFGAVMIATATLMLRGRRAQTSAKPTRPLVTLLLGAAVGLLSGLVGAGGGFMIVPALVLVGGLPMREAIGTSLYVIALQSFAGFAGHAAHVTLDPRLTAIVTAAAVVGSLAGATLGGRVPVDVLRRAFAWLVVAMGLFVFAKELPRPIAIVVVCAALAAVAFLGRGAAVRRTVQP